MFQNCPPDFLKKWKVPYNCTIVQVESFSAVLFRYGTGSSTSWVLIFLFAFLFVIDLRTYLNECKKCVYRYMSWYMYGILNLKETQSRYRNKTFEVSCFLCVPYSSIPTINNWSAVNLLLR